MRGLQTSIALAIAIGNNSTTLEVEPPIPPGNNYVIPTPDVTVTNSADFITAVQSSPAKVIKVMNGAYTKAAELVAGAGHKIYCETYNGVTFDFGIRFNYMLGWEIHGGVFNITSAAKAATDGGFICAILNWFSVDNCNAILSDITIDGSASRVLTQGMNFGSPDGVSVERCVITRCTDEGIRISDNSPSSTAVIAKLWDLNVSGIYRTPRGASDGTAEAGVWISHEVTADVKRIKVRDCGWQGLALNNLFNDTTMTDLDIDGIWGTVPPAHTVAAGTGVYFEKNCRRIIMENFSIGPDLIGGVNGEWDSGTPGNAAMNQVTIRNGTIAATRAGGGNGTAGIYMDAGSDGNTVTNVTFIGMSWACIGFYLNVNTPTSNFSGNDYSGRGGGCVRGTTDHRTDPTPTEAL